MLEWSSLRQRAGHGRDRLELKPCLQCTGLLSVALQLSLDKIIKKLTQQGTLLSLSYKLFHFLCNACAYSTVFALLISVIKSTCYNCLKINQQLLKLPAAWVEKYSKPQCLKRKSFPVLLPVPLRKQLLSMLPPPGKIYNTKQRMVQRPRASRDLCCANIAYSHLCVEGSGQTMTHLS